MWLLVGIFLVNSILLFSAIRQKDAVSLSFQTEMARADQLQEQLDALKNSQAGSQGAEIARLRADNLD